MTDVVLVNWGTETSAEPVQREHLGLGYLTAFLIQSGYSVRFWDGAFLPWDEARLATAICQEDPVLVGFSLFLTNVEPVLRLIRQIRPLGFKGHITLGGHHATFHSQEILLDNPEVDSVVLGEGEGALAELAELLRARRPWRQVANLACRSLDNLTVQCNPCRPLIPNLDALPFPTRQPYVPALRQNRVAAMISSRGCHGTCGFCSIRSFYRLSPGKLWRWRSHQNVVDEMEMLVREYGMEAIIFLDDNFLGPGRVGRRRAADIAAEILARGLKVHWSIACRADAVDQETLEALLPAGLTRVDLGLESWVPRQLALYHKGVTVAQNQRALEVLQNLKLQYRLYLIPLDPFVTPEELLQNIRHMRQQGMAHVNGPFFNRLLAFKGTSLAESLADSNLLRLPSSGKSYRGPLKYNFQHPLMEKIAASLERLDQGLESAVQRIKQMFPWPSVNEAERAFSGELIRAVGEAILELGEEVVLACQENPQADAASLADKSLAEIDAALNSVAEAQAEGRLLRFATLAVKIGSRTAVFPSAEIRKLTAALLGAFQETAGDHDLSHVN